MAPRRYISVASHLFFLSTSEKVGTAAAAAAVAAAAHLNSRDAANQIAFLFPRAGERGAGETGATPARSEVSLVTCNFSRAAERARFRGDSHSSSKP